jgi:hypothetical protein
VGFEVIMAAVMDLATLPLFALQKFAAPTNMKVTP